jgi:two-component system response regulator ArlR
MAKILICEDEENIVSFLQTELHCEGFITDAAFDGDEGLAKFNADTFDLVLLDIMLPVKNGLACLREIRKKSDVPVIILTARKDVYDKVAFLNAGADDYITKPFDTLELIARIRRNIQRGKTESGLQVNKESYQAFFNGTEIPFTKTEFEILVYLYERKNAVKTRDEIIKAVFGDFYGESNIIDVNIKNIRAKLRLYNESEIIHTVRGKGYVIRI